jgi:DNA-directed RNA polymerase specialized sigma24 family protein
MQIPKDVERRAAQLSAEMASWAYRAVGSFAARLDSQERLALAKDVVQNTWLHIQRMPEPPTTIQNWGAYLRAVLLKKCKEAGRDELRWRRTAGEAFQRTGDLELVAVGLNPQDILLASETDETLHHVYSLVADAARAYICVCLGREEDTLSAFLEVVRIFISNDGMDFDTARQHVEEYRPRTPSKATCGRWWLTIRKSVAAQLARRGVKP